MRTLKTPDEIQEVANVHGTGIFYKHEVDAMIKAAQRDALECAADNAKLEVIEVPGAGAFMHRIVKSSIINLLPKE